MINITRNSCGWKNLVDYYISSGFRKVDDMDEDDLIKICTHWIMDQRSIDLTPTIQNELLSVINDEKHTYRELQKSILKWLLSQSIFDIKSYLEEVEEDE